MLNACLAMTGFAILGAMVGLALFYVVPLATIPWLLLGQAFLPVMLVLFLAGLVYGAMLARRHSC